MVLQVVTLWGNILTGLSATKALRELGCLVEVALQTSPLTNFDIPNRQMVEAWLRTTVGQSIACALV